MKLRCAIYDSHGRPELDCDLLDEVEIDGHNGIWHFRGSTWKIGQIRVPDEHDELPWGVVTVYDPRNKDHINALAELEERIDQLIEERGCAICSLI